MKELNNFFYISSSGSTATAWLAKTFSLHPEIHLPHGNPIDLPLDPRNEELIKHLNKMARGEVSQKSGSITGGIHWSNTHGTTLRKAVQKLGGKFAGIIREPIPRVYSQFIVKSKAGVVRPETKQAFIQGDITLFKAYCLALKREPEQAELELLRACRSTFYHDGAIMLNCSRKEIFKFEDFTADIDHYKTLMKHVIGDKVTITDEFIKLAFNTKPINHHIRCKARKTPEIIFQNLSHEYQLLFTMTFLHLEREEYTKRPSNSKFAYRPTVLTLYGANGYKALPIWMDGIVDTASEILENALIMEYAPPN